MSAIDELRGDPGNEHRPVSTVAAQTLMLLFGMLAVCGLAGVLMAAFFVPAVTLTSKVAEEGVTMFDSFPTELEVAPLNESSRIEAADGSLLATFYTENRIMVPLDQISPHMQHAVVAVEDRRFYEHGGIDPKGMVRALLSNSVGGPTQGGSTLTQQYIKNALLMDAVQKGDKEGIAKATEQSYGRKLREAKLAISLEKKWSKDEILNGYLNLAQFGPSQYGVQTASLHYFSKNAADLNPGEAAMLAAITNGPNQYDPVKHPESGQKRRNEVLRDMLNQGYIDQPTFDQYSQQPVQDMLHVQNVTAGCADAGGSGFFCDYVSRVLVNDPKFAATPEERRKLLYGGGLTIRTTLDPGKQKIAEDIVNRKVAPDAQKGFGHSIVTVEPGTGKILVMAQNRTFNPYQDAGVGQTAINFNVPHQYGGGNGFPVGSTYKPFVLTQYLETGHSIYDTVATARGPKASFPARCLNRGRWYQPSDPWDPDNAVGFTLPPEQTVLDATKFSVNTSYAQIALRIDLCDIGSRARTMGAVPASFNRLAQDAAATPIEDIYGSGLAPAALVLGEQNISALDMAAAYATFASGGTYCVPTPITSVADRDGKEMPTSGSQCSQVLDQKVADAVSWVLEQDLSDPRATGKGMVIPGQTAGGKTGTSSREYHTWYVGFTKQFSTAVWYGSPTGNVPPQGTVVDGRTLSGDVYGNTVSLPTWQEYMTDITRGLPNIPFPDQPPGGSLVGGGDPQGDQPAAGGDTVPDVAGKSPEDATAALSGAGYQVSQREGKSDRVPEGQVIGTDPEAGSQLAKGAPVSIIVSAGS
ncbi:penicillin-binding protein [Brachybacterium sp. AOP25-B2-12]|uniref:penicillin-binding protein n=1 Tax=Brachybacterium sp. AOP25-B2-12 TaxID=3457710 RepID=UPI004033BD0D